MVLLVSFVVGNCLLPLVAIAVGANNIPLLARPLHKYVDNKLFEFGFDCSVVALFLYE